MKVKNFNLDESCMCDVTVRKEWGLYDHIPADKLTDEQFMKILKGEDRCSSTGSKDHPDFASLRDQLEAEGYIKTERGWWNGDKVTKTFKLNGVLFRRNQRFPSGAAMRHHIEFKRKFPNSDY